MKKIYLVIMTLIFIGCGKSIESKNPENIEKVESQASKTTSSTVDPGLLNVEITIPAVVFASEDMTKFDVNQYVKENGFKSAVVNSDGSITVVMSKIKHTEAMKEMAESINKSFEDLKLNTPYIKDITSNADFSSVIIDVDRTGYESTLDFTPLAISFGAGIYHSIAGIDPKLEITIRDSNSHEIIKTVIPSENQPAPITLIPTLPAILIPTIGPEQTVISGNGSRSNPIPLGQPTDLIYQSTANFQITVLDVNRGQSAWNKVYQANQFNDPPAAGMDYIVAKIAVNYQTSSQQDFELLVSSWSFKSVSNNQVLETPSIVDPDPELNANLFPGGQSEGYIVVSAYIDDPTPLIVYEDWTSFDSKPFYFAIQ